MDKTPPNINRYIRLLTRKLDIKQEISMLLKDCNNNPKDARYEHLIRTVEETNMSQLMEVICMAKALTPEERTAFEKLAEKFNLKNEWTKQARLEGKLEGEVSSLLRILSKKFKTEISQSLKNKILAVDNKNIVEKILDNIFEISSLEQVESYLDTKERD